MPGATQHPELGRETDRIIRRLEQRERKAGSKKTRYFSVPFSYPGILQVGTVSPPWYPDVPAVLIQLRLSLLSTGSVTVEVAVDGTAFDSYSLSGITAVHAIPNLVITPGSYLTLEVTAASGAEMSAIFKARERG